MSMKGGSGDQRETANSRALADRGAMWAKTRQEIFVPLERQMVERAKDVGEERGRLLGDANAKFQQAHGAVQEKINASQVSQGANALAGAISGGTRDAATSTGLGLADVSQGVADTEASTRQAMIDHGLGRQAQTTAGFGQMAQISAQQAAEDAQLSAQRNASRAQFVGTLAAAGTHQAKEAGMFSKGTGVKTSHNMPDAGGLDLAAHDSLQARLRTIDPLRG